MPTSSHWGGPRAWRTAFAACAAGLAVLAAGAPLAQVASPAPKTVFWAHSLALSPDGSKLAFVWRGDIWVAPSDGGAAAPITSHVEMDDNPVFSPDGSWIAFSSNRNGGSDIFVVPSTGGEASRITWHPGAEVPTGWSPDSRQILFRASREGEENAVYSIDIRTLDLKLLLRDNRPVGSPKLSADGRTLLYTRYGFPWTRPRYHGSGALQLWTMDMATGRRESYRNTGFQNLWPSYLADGRVAAVTVDELTPSSSPMGKPIPKNVDNVDRTPNVHIYGPGRSSKRVTSFVGGPVRYLAAAAKADRLAFEQEGKVYVMTSTTAPKEVVITAAADEKFNNEDLQILTEGAGDASLSPDGKTFLFTAQNDVWSVPVEQGKRPNSKDARQLTDWPGLDGDPIWAPDGKAAFFTSDRDGAVRLYRMVLETKAIAPVTKLDEDVLELQLTPDKKKLSFWVAGSKGGLYTVPVEGGEPSLVLSLPRPYRYENDTRYAWSPDGRYVAFSLRRPTTSVNIYLYDTTAKKLTNVTQMVAEHGSPAFSPDGRYLYFFGQRQQAAIMVVPLTQEAIRTEDGDLKYEKPKEAPKVEIDVDQINLRVRTFLPGGASGLMTDPETGRIYFVRDGSIWQVDYDGQNAKVLVAGGVWSFTFSNDGSRLVFVKDGLPQFVELRKNGNPVTKVEFRAEWVHNVKGERKAAFSQFWREYNRTFYDGNFHGRDWTAIRKRYEPLLDGVGHRNEFATLLNMMVGELESSHSEVGPAPGGPPASSVGHLGVTFDYSYKGPGIRIAEVPARSPGSYTQTRLGAGEIILEINGSPAKLNESLWKTTLLEQDGRDVTLTVANAKLENRRTVRIKALSQGEWSNLLYRNRIDDRRRLVEAKSNGQIAYLEIPGMGGEQLRNFNFEAWEMIQGKKGVIIDVRNNGGGNISDDLINLIGRRPHGYTQLRDSDVEPSPDRSWTDDLQVIVMISETSYSDAELYPSGMRGRGFAKILGMPTPGYVIGTYGLRLLDGTNARMPAWGWYRLDGSNTENNGLQPDYLVDWPVEDYLKGTDDQLERAVSELMKSISKS